MQTLSERPIAVSAESVQFAVQDTAGPDFCIDEEFPADLPVLYDWTLQPAFRRSLRRALRFLAVTIAALITSALSYLVYNLPR